MELSIGIRFGFW